MRTQLQIEYACTQSEYQAAILLQSSDQSNRPTKRRFFVFRIALMVGFLALVYLRIKDNVPNKYLPWYLVGFGAFIYILVFLIRDKPKGDERTVRLEISKEEIVSSTDMNRVTMFWSSFERLIESAELFVLVDRHRTTLHVIPKRAFPDTEAQDWFRSIATNAINETKTSTATSGKPLALDTDSIELLIELKFTDYLTRYLVSWRIKGISILALTTVSCSLLWQQFHPSSSDVNSPLTVALILIPSVIAMLIFVMFAASAFWWVAERKQRQPCRYNFADRGIEFSQAEACGQIEWRTFDCYLENRRVFILWGKRNSLWRLIPKRAFTSDAEVSRFRKLLQKKLQKSRWFFY